MHANFLAWLILADDSKNRSDRDVSIKTCYVLKLYLPYLDINIGVFHRRVQMLEFFGE